MSQHPMTIVDGTGQEVLDAVTGAVQALASCSSGAGSPQTTYAYQLWADTTAGKLKIRNAANTGWVIIGDLGTANLGLQVAAVALAALAGLTPAADALPYFSGTNQAALAAFTAAARTLLAASDQAAQQAALGLGSAATLVADTDGTLAANSDAKIATQKATRTYVQSAVAGKQPLDAELTALAALVSAENKLPYFTGSGSAALANFTAAARTLLAAADDAAQRTALGLGNVNNTDDLSKPVSSSQRLTMWFLRSIN